MGKAPEECLYCDHDDPNCGFCEMGKPLDTQEDWDRTWGRVLGEGPSEALLAAIAEAAERPN